MAQPRQSIETVISDFRQLHDVNKQVVIAISGGVDSAAMLFCLSRIRSYLQPVFVYHGIRSAAEEKQSYTAALEACHRCGLSNLKTSRFDPNSGSSNYKTEEEARKLRYRALAEKAGHNGVIATAHHADDQLETLLMRLCRGSGITGLSSIPPSSRVPFQTTNNCKVIRPMLRLTKNDCIEICKRNNIPWHEDITNSDTNITRNRLRRDVLPILKELYPQCSRHASEAAFKLRDISNIIDSRIKYLRHQETPCEHGICIKTDLLQTETDSVLAAYCRDVAIRLNDNKKLDKINSQVISKLIFAIRQKQSKNFDWPMIKVEISLENICFTIKV